MYMMPCSVRFPELLYMYPYPGLQMPGVVRFGSGLVFTLSMATAHITREGCRFHPSLWPGS
jgi:hypothetical protein